MSEDIVIAGGGPNGLMLACELSLAGARPLLPDLTSRAIAEAATGWRDRVDVIAAQDIAAAAVLVRPDGYVAWAADTVEVRGLRAALLRWFGRPLGVRQRWVR